MADSFSRWTGQTRFTYSQAATHVSQQEQSIHTSDPSLPVNPPPTDFYTDALAKNHHPFPIVRQHAPATPFPHPQFPSFWKRQLTSPTHNLVISLPHRFYTSISWQNQGISLASSGNRTRASAVEVRRLAGEMLPSCSGI